MNARKETPQEKGGEISRWTDLFFRRYEGAGAAVEDGIAWDTEVPVVVDLEEKIIRAKLVGKRIEIKPGTHRNIPGVFKRIFIFELPDEPNHPQPMVVWHVEDAAEVFALAVKNDEGFLFYQEPNVFLDFQRDGEIIEDKPLSLYDKLYKTNNGKGYLLAMAILLGFGIFILWGLFVDHFASKIVAWLSLFGSFAAVVAGFGLPHWIKAFRLRHSPEQKARVKVLESREDKVIKSTGTFSQEVSVFEFSDGSRKCLVIPWGDIPLPVVGDTGILRYQEHGSDTRFIAFEGHE